MFKVTKWGVRYGLQVVGNYYDLCDRSRLIIFTISQQIIIIIIVVLTSYSSSS